MFFNILLFLFIGTVLGVLTGLAPGIHPNTVVLAVPFLFSLSVEPLPLLAMVVSMSVVNSVMDYIPSILLGAPESGTELSVLPGHRLMLKGYGYAAIKLAVIGAVGSVLVSLALMPVVILFFKGFYEFIRPYIGLILVCFVAFMLLGEKNRLYALMCFILSSIIGLISLNFPVDKDYILFPVLSGLFGLSGLLIQINQRSSLPPQKIKDIYVSQKTIGKSVILGTISGFFAGFLPGIGSSQVAALVGNENSFSFLLSSSAINTANTMFAFIALWVIGKPRSGAAVAIDQVMRIGFSEFLFIIAISVISCSIASVLTLATAKFVIRNMQKIEYSLVNKFVFLFICVLIFVFTGVHGLLLAAVCCSLGVLTAMLKVRRSNLMGVLLTPTIIFFLAL